MMYHDSPADRPPSHMEYKVTPSMIKAVAADYMSQLDGWCSSDKANLLIDLILRTKPKVIVEIGVYGGKSFVPMAYAQKMTGQGISYGIDPWDSHESIQWVKNEINRDFWGRVDHLAVLRHLEGKIAEFGLDGQIVLIKSTSERAPPIADIDLLHIDGNHSEETSYLDVVKWVPLVRPGGWIIFDDMTWYEEGKYTTAKAVEWLNEHARRVTEFSDICMWGIWVKQ